jgi:CheY-like chemotaxis protein
LIVDDNLDGAEMLAQYLSFLGYETTIATDGSQALAAMSQDTLDVALLGVGLPGMNGYEVAIRAAEQLGSRAPRFIGVTGLSDSAERGREAGFVCHLAKPVDLDQLAATLQRVLGAPRLPPSSLGA